MSDENTGLRDQLANDRTHLANERTLMAFIRTALAFIGLGLFLLKFYSGIYAVILSVSGGVVGLLLLVIGISRFNKMRKKLDSSI